MSLSLVDQRLQLRFNLGNGLVVVTYVHAPALLVRIASITARCGSLTYRGLSLSLVVMMGIIFT